MITPPRPLPRRRRIASALAALTVAVGMMLSAAGTLAQGPASRSEPLSLPQNGKDITKAAGPVGSVLPEGEPALVLALAFSPDGSTLALAGENPSVALRDAATNRTKAVLTAHTAPVAGLAFSPDSATLATCGYDRSIKLWDLLRRGGTADAGWPSRHGHGGGIRARREAAGFGRNLRRDQALEHVGWD